MRVGFAFNGKAESGVKMVENLLLKYMSEKGDMQLVLYVYAQITWIFSSSTSLWKKSDNAFASASSCFRTYRLFKFKEGVLDLDLKKKVGEEEVGVSVNLKNSQPQVQVQPSLRRSECLLEKSCKSASPCFLVWPATCAILLLTSMSSIGESCKGKTNKE